MGVYQSPSEVAGFEAAGCAYEDDAGAAESCVRRQAVDSEFLDAVCNGVVVIGRNFLITSQNYISKVNMGDLVGKCCYKALENRATPCEHCPRLRPLSGEYETSMRCTGEMCSLYEVRIYASEKMGEIIEVYPDMIDREIVVRNLHQYREELDLLNAVVENIRNAIADDITRS
jgi:hypothetical protein